MEQDAAFRHPTQVSEEMTVTTSGVAVNRNPYGILVSPQAAREVDDLKIKLLSKIMILSLFFVCVHASSEEKSLPPEIINDIPEMEIISSAHAALPDGYCWFVLARKENRINTLRYYVLSDNQFCLRFESEQCIPQDSDNLLIGIDFEFEDFTTHDQSEFPILTISQMNESEGYLEWFIGYENMYS